MPETGQCAPEAADRATNPSPDPTINPNPNRDPNTTTTTTVTTTQQHEEPIVDTLQDDNNNNVVVSVSAIQTQTTTTPPELSSTNQSSVNAVRVLFRDQSSTPLPSSGATTGTSELQNPPSNPPTLGLQPPLANVAILNRRLIERRLEAIQAADSRRWNFDFRRCRPLRIEGHRYQDVQCPPSGPQSAPCRMVSEQDIQDTETRFSNQPQQQWQQISGGQGSDSCKQTNRDKPEPKQDDE